jgi:GTP cyclohydrolase I
VSTPNPIRARGPIDLPKIQQAAADLLTGLGYDLDDESLHDTPSRADVRGAPHRQAVRIDDVPERR